jgi:hypothetical protein
MTTKELMEHMIAAFSDEGIKRQQLHEYRQGHPNLTDAELKLMVAAEEKHGHPPHSLAEAKKILAA